MSHRWSKQESLHPNEKDTITLWGKRYQWSLVDGILTLERAPDPLPSPPFDGIDGLAFSMYPPAKPHQEHRGFVLGERVAMQVRPTMSAAKVVTTP